MQRRARVVHEKVRMELPLDITWRHIPASPIVTEHIRERVYKLQQFCDRIVGCRVVVDAPHRHHRHGRLYEVSVDVTVPGRQLVAHRSPQQDHAHEDVLVAVRDAFEAAERRLEDYVRERRDAERTPSGSEGAPRASTLEPPPGVLHRLQEYLDASGVTYTIASHRPAFTAQEVARCDVGAMPPFGNLYGMPVYVDRTLAEEDEIVFQAGRHDQTIRMRYGDYAKLVEPIVGEFRLTHEEV